MHKIPRAHAHTMKHPRQAHLNSCPECKTEASRRNKQTCVRDVCEPTAPMHDCTRRFPYTSQCTRVHLAIGKDTPHMKPHACERILELGSTNTAHAHHSRTRFHSRLCTVRVLRSHEPIHAQRARTRVFTPRARARARTSLPRGLAFPSPSVAEPELQCRVKGEGCGKRDAECETHSRHTRVAHPASSPAVN